MALPVLFVVNGFSGAGGFFENALSKGSLDAFCLLYTSDAADDLLCVELGGRRIIKKQRTSIDS